MSSSKFSSEVDEIHDFLKFLELRLRHQTIHPKHRFTLKSLIRKIERTRKFTSDDAIYSVKLLKSLESKGLNQQLLT